MPTGVFPRTEEHRRKIGDALRGRKRAPFSAEWRERIGASRRGKRLPPRTEAHKEALRAAFRSPYRKCGPCAICEKVAPLDQDHDHRDGQLRGLLCRQCNVALGQLRDEDKIVAKALEYLRHWKSEKRMT